MHRLLEDPWVAARIDDALAPYAGTVSDQEFEWMREQLAETLAADPAAARALRRAAPRQVDRSGEVLSEGSGDPGDQADDHDGRATG